eukprot:scaffold69013_cov27-Tisochrysis_lutea.AAC.1
MKATVKESQDGEFVKRTLDRKTLWEIHTPQVVRPEVRVAQSRDVRGVISTAGVTGCTARFNEILLLFPGPDSSGGLSPVQREQPRSDG